VTVALAVAGALVAVVTALHGPPEPAPGLGVPESTSFGTLTVTGAETGFVPSTQGPPTMARMMGRTGTGQLRVWVELTNTAGVSDLRISPEQFRLGGVGAPLVPDGSTLRDALLPPGAVIDGQVWFDLPDSEAAETRPAHRWLQFTGADGRRVRVPLGDVHVEGTEHGHGHH
jgi:hypothetical protein